MEITLRILALGVIKIFMLFFIFIGFISLIFIFSQNMNKIVYYCSETLRNYILAHLIILYCRMLIAGIYFLFPLTYSNNRELYAIVDLITKIIHVSLWFCGTYIVAINGSCYSTFYYTLNLIFVIILPMSVAFQLAFKYLIIRYYYGIDGPLLLGNLV